MPKNQDSLNADLFALLQSRGYSPTMLDTSGKEVPVADEAEVFQFNFVKDETDYGTVTVSIDGLHKLIIYFDDKVANSPKERSESGEQNWYSVLKQLKDFARKHQLSFEIRNTDKLRYDMKKREHLKQLDESYHAVNKHKSYSDNIPETKIVIQHSKVMEDGEQRFRHVDKIFIENTLGERILAPTNKPGIAQVYARHLAEGGKPHDIRWQHIGAMVEEYSKMAGFVRATRGNQFNESAQRLVNEGLSHYQKLRESLSKMRGKRGYNNYFESWTPPLMEDEEQVDLSEMFMQSSLDPRIESVMPILGKLSKNLGEAKDMAEVIALENWADEIITHKGGKVTRDGNVTRHVAGPDVYGGTVPDEEHDKLDKSFVNKAEKELGIKWNREKKRAGGIDLGEVKDEEADYGDEYQSDVMKLKQKAHAQEKKKPVDITDLARRLHAIMKKDDEQVEEDLDSNQKRAGQLGPTGGPAKVGDLVGANESFINTTAQAVTTEEGVVENVDIGKEWMSDTELDQYVPDALEQEWRELVGYNEDGNAHPLWINMTGDYEPRSSDPQHRAWMVKVANKWFAKKKIPNVTFFDVRDHDTEDELEWLVQIGPQGVAEMDSEGYKGTRDDDNKGPESKGKPITANKAKKDFGKILQKSVDKYNKAKQDTDKKVAQHQVKESIQLDEGVMDSIKGIVGKIKAIPGIQKFIQAAQAKKAELIQAAQQSRNGQELVKNIQATMGGQQAVAEGWGQKLSGGLVASAGGGLMATGAEMFMRAWNAMGKPDLAQMMTDPGRDGQIVLALVTMLVLVGALSLFGGGHMFKQGLEKDAQPMREGQEDLEAILRIIKK